MGSIRPLYSGHILPNLLGIHRPMILTTNDMARELGISRQRVLKLAESYGLGTKIGRDMHYTDADLETLRTRKDRRYKMTTPATTTDIERAAVTIL